MVIWLRTLLALVLWTPALIGLGSLVRLDIPKHLRTGLTGLLGMAVLAGPALWLSLVRPVSSWIALFLFLAGLASLALRWRQIGGGLWIDATLILGLSAVVAAQPLTTVYDSGLYYFQAVEWAREHAAVPGLANLHGRLGFNSVWFVVSAALELPGMRNGSGLFAGGLPVVLAGCVALRAIGAIWRGDRSLANFIFALLVIPVIVGLTGIGSHATDDVALLFGWVAIGLLVAVVDEGEGSRNLAAGLLMAAMAMALKLSTIVVSATAVAVAFTIVRTQRGGDRARFLTGMAAWPTALAVPWLIRGFITSGCWLYPMPASCWPAVSWAVPAESAGAMVALIRRWAHSPGGQPEEVLSNGGWLGSWASRISADPLILAFAGFFAVGIAAFLWKRPRPARSGWVLVTVGMGGTGFWMWSAPDPRLGLVYLLALATLPGALALGDETSFTTRGLSWPRTLAVTIVALAVTVTLVLLVPAWRQVKRGFTLRGSWPALRQVPFRVEKNTMGVRVRVPAEGDQCWHTPIPCTPHLDASLDLVGGTYRISR